MHTIHTTNMQTCIVCEHHERLHARSHWNLPFCHVHNPFLVHQRLRREHAYVCMYVYVCMRKNVAFM